MNIDVLHGGAVASGGDAVEDEASAQRCLMFNCHPIFFSFSECLCKPYTMALHNFEGTSLTLHLPEVIPALSNVTQGDTSITYSDTSRLQFYAVLQCMPRY